MGKVKGLFMDKQEAMIDCPECEYEGRCEYEREVPMSNSNPYGYLETYWVECDNCKGTGRIERDDYDAARYASKPEKLKAAYKAARDAYWAELKKTKEEKQNDLL
jgi:hypothetical protein